MRPAPIAAAALALSLAQPTEGHTSTFASWQKSLPGMCVSVEISVGAHSDGGGTEARVVRETRAELDRLVPRLAPALAARLAHYAKRGVPALAPTEIAPCLDEAHADDPRHVAYTDAQRWSAAVQLETVAGLLATTRAATPPGAPAAPDPMLAGVSSWRGVTVRLRLARPTPGPLRDKLAWDFVIAQFHGGPPARVDGSIRPDLIESKDFAPPGAWLFAGLAAVAKDRTGAAARKHPVLDALAATLDEVALPATAATIPPPLLVALWSPRETAALPTWAARLGARSYFDGDDGTELVRYLAATGTPLPPLPSAPWQARLAAAQGNLAAYDAFLADLMKPRVAVADEDAMITTIYDAYRARPTYNEWESVVRVLTQLGFAQRRIAVADALYLRTARLATGAAPLPAGYEPAGLLRAVIDALWRSAQPLSATTIAGVVDEALRAKPLAEDVLPTVVSTLLNIPWSVPDRVALVTKVTRACASCRAEAKRSIKRAAEVERAATKR